VGDVIEQFAVGSLSIQRWRRFGMDRLYVEADGGRKVGWIDLETGESTIESPGDAELFEQAVTNWRDVLPLGQSLRIDVPF
jgi:predicted RNase H-like nuclease